jgi:hypothetical protein
MKATDSAHAGDGDALLPQSLLFVLGKPTDIARKRCCVVEHHMNLPGTLFSAR